MNDSPSRLRSAWAWVALPILLLLVSCGSPSEDMHNLPREPKAYESVDPSALSKAELLQHLQTLTQEIEAAVAAEAPAEFHHLEVALTPTLEALEPHAVGNARALASIETLKQLAIKLHEAGHDGNVAMGEKLAPQIKKLADEISAALQ